MYKDKYTTEHTAQLSTWIHNTIHYAICEYEKRYLSVLADTSYMYNAIRKLEKEGSEVSVENLVKILGLSYKTASSLPVYLHSFSGYGYGVHCDIDENLIEAVDGKKFVPKEISSITDFNFNDFKHYLTDAEIDIIENYFGFNGKRMKMEAIGEEIGKSQKAVSYAINKALVKLRKAPGMEEFADMVR